MNADEITRRREALGLSKSALARESNLNVSTISAVENGHMKLYPGQESKLREAFERLESEAVNEG